MTLQMALSRELFSARQRMGYTQFQAAEAACISLRGYQQLESGNALPGMDTFLHLQKYLHLNCEPLLQLV